MRRSLGSVRYRTAFTRLKSGAVNVKIRLETRNVAHVKRILIVDDSPIIRRSLRIVLEQQPDWGVCGEAGNGRDGIDKALQLRPDLVVIDLVMPVMNGIEASRTLKKLAPATTLVMFTTFADPCLTKDALAAGVDAVVPKSEGATTLIRSIQTLLVTKFPPPASAA